MTPAEHLNRIVQISHALRSAEILLEVTARETMPPDVRFQLSLRDDRVDIAVVDFPCNEVWKAMFRELVRDGSLQAQGEALEHVEAYVKATMGKDGP